MLTLAQKAELQLLITKLIIATTVGAYSAAMSIDTIDVVRETKLARERLDAFIDSLIEVEG